MATYSRSIVTIAELTRLYRSGELVIQPKFQRRSIWTPDARSYLIDTIVRALPMPKVYLRKHVVDKNSPTIYEVVDGQQRLNSIFDFVDGKYELKQKHNSDFPNMRFNDLPDALRRSFQGYQIAVEIMEDASDSEVWGMFERLNRYTFTVNQQERRNAQFSGVFKQLCYRLAAEQISLATWKQMGIFGDQQIARMREVEMTSDVLAAMLKGITDIAYLSSVYREYDDDLPNREHLEETFRKVIRFIRSDLMQTVRTTKFRLQVRTYSLMVGLADAFAGIPNGLGPKEVQDGGVIRRRMVALDNALRPTEVPDGLAELKRALTSATSHVRERSVRNDHIVNMLSLPESEWNSRWRQLTNQE